MPLPVSQEAYAATTMQAVAQLGRRDANEPGQVATRTQPANWFGGDHAGLSQTSGLGGGMAVRADAAREEEFLSVYSMAHADKVLRRRQEAPPPPDAPQPPRGGAVARVCRGRRGAPAAALPRGARLPLSRGKDLREWFISSFLCKSH